MKSHSLRGRLLWFVLVAILLAAVLQAATAYRSALQQADAMFDDHLQQVARSLRSSIPLGSLLAEGEDNTDFDLYVQIWGKDGTQLFRSTHSALPPRAVLGFSDVEANGSRYRVYSLQAPQQTVQIAQDLSARTARAQALAVRAVLPFVLLTPLLMLAVWWVINRSLAPIERARRDVARRAADDFSPLADTGLPEEVRPLVEELNLLFGRVRNAFDAQKNFVADAAHELRSPLTALKLQAQALRQPNHGGDDADGHQVTREADVARLNQGIDRAIRLVEQLLILARAEAGAQPASASETPLTPLTPLTPALPVVSAIVSAPQVDLTQVIQLAVTDLLPQAGHKHIDLGLSGDTPTLPVMVAGQSEALRMMLRNLLDNAVKYTPAGGQVDVSLEVEDDRCVLSVEDSGPGIAQEDRTRVFDRFFRATEAAHETGSGLGLAIVKVIAAQHGATITLAQSAHLGGLLVQVRLSRCMDLTPPLPATRH